MDTVTANAAESLADSVAAAMPLRILFVCTGNTCRSPMAAAVLNALGKGFYTAESAGLYPSDGSSIARYAILALEDAGIFSSPDNNYRNNTARSVTESLIGNSDRVIGMTESHAMMLIQTFPAYASKIAAMKKDICDPYGGTTGDYKRCLAEITDCLRDMFLLEP